jgi:CRP-like cAMP-binding protein
MVREGEAGESLFLIARGVVRVSRQFEGGRADIATLVAGDFFGEMALLHDEPRSATVTAVTPCALYELSREAAVGWMEQYPAIRAALEAADRKRKTT